MTEPGDGSTYAALASIILAADTTDSDSSVFAVEFSNGGTLIASLTTPPYAYT